MNGWCGLYTIPISCDHLSCPSLLGVKEHEIRGRLQRGETDGSSKDGRIPIEEVEGKSLSDAQTEGVIAVLLTIAPGTKHKAAAGSDPVVVYQAGFQLSPYF